MVTPNRIKGVVFSLIMSLALISLGQDSGEFFNLRADQLTDDQLRQMLERASDAGYSEQDMYIYAQSKGIPEEEIFALQDRIKQLDSPKEIEETEIQAEESKTEIREEPSEVPAIKHFGYGLFQRNWGAVSFETNLFIPTPEDYVIGPTDELVINIYGESEKNYQERVNVGGFLLIRNVGPIYVSGLTLRQAEKKIKGNLATVYSDLISEDPNTFLQVSIGKVRTISVNLVGELRTPGTYTVNGLSTVFNAIYVAGGPTLNGTMREIKVFRKDKQIATLDYYDFLINGFTKSNIRLRNDDLILVGPHHNRATIEGEVKRPGIYEMKDGETFHDLLRYAGGFSDLAYKERVSVTRNTGKEKLVSDIMNEQHKLFTIQGGDNYQVGRILNRYENRVTIEGSVFRPGNYALSDELTLSQLIDRAEGLTGDAFMGRAILTRTLENLNTEVTAVNLNQVLSDKDVDIVLRREDVLRILSIHDLKSDRFVKISGEVRLSGTYPFSEGMTVSDLALMANGLEEAASTGTIEVTRRPENQSSEKLTDIFNLTISSDLSIGDSEFELKPYDHVIVRRNPDFYLEKAVQIYGEVKFQGEYVLTSEGERISDLVKRAGGTKSGAYIAGATLLRKTEFFRNAQAQERVQLIESTDVFSDGGLGELFSGPETQENLDVTTRAKQERLEQLARNNPFLDDIKIDETESIALNLNEILSNPGSSEDLILEEGDIINIPKELKTLRLRGRVLYPNSVRFEEGKGLRYFIGKAGGFGARAFKRRTYVVYANGEVSRTRGYLFFKSYPKPAPGAEVIIPAKPIKVPIKPGEFIGITSGLATIALLITQILR